ncbi:unnamed protein product [Hermetia illucens]|uniref:GATA zinc finger domain-containing protein 1 n=1 Tax=Hermetia illucens TaxID=343691 RepID=A0A7R8V006_HERIL|nr:GATA zinc finger domain-containing protein 1 [Hermetia illucens]CAD7089721.1 unnamed protein product [Hermetia illucens]
MPQKVTLKCVQCEKTESPMWRSIEGGQICHDCYEQNGNNLKGELEPDNENSNGNGEEKKLRKSTRSTRYKAKNSAPAKPIPKGRSRRYIFKKTPFKAPVVPATTHTVESTFYKGSYLQVGDIVSLMDKKDNIYYAQIRGLLVDTYCEKSAFITWLIPTAVSPPPNERFDPATYLIGPDEDCPRKLSCLEFVMHAPSNYYHDKTTPFPPPASMDFESPATGFVWTSLPEFDPKKAEKIETADS